VSRPSRRTVNRTILAAAGLLLLVGGLLVLAGGFDVYGRLGFDMPDWWPLASPDQPVLSAESRTRWTDEEWWWPVAIAVPALLVAGGLWWLFAQVRRSGPAGIALPSPAVAGPHFALRVRSRAVEDAIETEAVELPDVARVTVRVTGASHRPEVRTALRMEAGGAPADLLESFHTGPLEHARASLGLPELPSELRIRVSHRTRRATVEHRRPRVR